MPSSTMLGRAAVLTLLLVSCTSGRPADADANLDLSTFRACTRCDLTPQLVVTLGERDGDGAIEENRAIVRVDPRTRSYLVFHVGTSHLLLFDEAGSFVRRIGTRGGGPGELQGIIDAHFAGDRIVVIENGGPKIVQFALDGSVVAETRLGHRPGPFIPANDSAQVVLGVYDPSPDTSGNRLHVIDLASGVAIGGLAPVDTSQHEPRAWARRILLAREAASADLWLAQPLAFRFERWSADGELSRIVHGEPSWFASEPGSGREAPPRNALLTFAIDSAQRLWTATQVADARWREAPRHGAEGFVLAADLDRLFDARIDVYDLRQRRHLGRLIRDEAHAGLIEQDGRIMVQRVQLDMDDQPAVALYWLELPA